MTMTMTVTTTGDACSKQVNKERIFVLQPQVWLETILSRNEYGGPSFLLRAQHRRTIAVFHHFFRLRLQHSIALLTE
jgi:hypothetical protein